MSGFLAVDMERAAEAVSGLLVVGMETAVVAAVEVAAAAAAAWGGAAVAGSS